MKAQQCDEWTDQELRCERVRGHEGPHRTTLWKKNYAEWPRDNDGQPVPLAPTANKEKTDLAARAASLEQERDTARAGWQNANAVAENAINQLEEMKRALAAAQEVITGDTVTMQQQKVAMLVMEKRVAELARFRTSAETQCRTINGLAEKLEDSMCTVAELRDVIETQALELKQQQEKIVLLQGQVEGQAVTAAAHHDYDRLRAERDRFAAELKDECKTSGLAQLDVIDLRRQLEDARKEAERLKHEAGAACATADNAVANEIRVTKQLAERDAEIERLKSDLQILGDSPVTLMSVQSSESLRNVCREVADVINLHEAYRCSEVGREEMRAAHKRLLDAANGTEAHECHGPSDCPTCLRRNGTEAKTEPTSHRALQPDEMKAAQKIAKEILEEGPDEPQKRCEWKDAYGRQCARGDGHEDECVISEEMEPPREMCNATYEHGGDLLRCALPIHGHDRDNGHDSHPGTDEGAYWWDGNVGATPHVPRKLE